MSRVNELNPIYQDFLQRKEQLKRMQKEIKLKRNECKECEKTLLSHFRAQNKTELDLLIEPSLQVTFGNCTQLRVRTVKKTEPLGKKKLFDCLQEYFQLRVDDPTRAIAMANELHRFLEERQKKTETQHVMPVYPKTPAEDELESEDDM